MSQEITQDILTQAVEEVIEECGRPNLAALERKLPLTREQLKRLKKNNFVLKPNGNLGKHKDRTKLSGFEENINSFLLKGVTNSQVIFDSIVKQGYKDSGRCDTKQRQTLRDRTRRAIPDGLGIRQGCR